MTFLNVEIWKSRLVWTLGRQLGINNRGTEINHTLWWRTFLL